MVRLGGTTVILTVTLLTLVLSLGTYAQTELPWYWWDASPTIPQTYGKCSSLRAVPLDFDAFQVGCYDLYTGLPLNCHEDWTEFFSTDGLQDPATILYYEGGHVHPRSGDVAMTTGGLYSDLSGVADTNTFTGDTGGQIWTGYKYHPQCSGVVRITARCIAPLTTTLFLTTAGTWTLPTPAAARATLKWASGFTWTGLSNSLRIPLSWLSVMPGIILWVIT
ncbi:MAG: hypothetical protein ACP5VF_06500 [Acidobacteriota bacterium]